MMRLVAICLALLAACSAACSPARAQEEVVLGLSQNRVQITANFDGSEILIFGAVKRESKIPEIPLDVIVTVAGPSRPVVVHRKDRVLGIWVNAETSEIDSAPTFYTVATTGPLNEVLSHTEDLRHSITIRRAVRSVGSGVADPGAFMRSLVRIREEAGIYRLQENEVEMDQQTLFRTRVALPANLTEGGYETRVFLTRQGKVVAHFDTVIEVRKAGLERWLYTMANEKSAIYAVLSLILAVAAGWGASAGFRLLRG
ncbi:membrane protein [Oceanicola sp. 22II-s10i]|uniref:TIGR02186 family protein n=1 Tax=Oceanicola sp. 22II-s10i TaxID=1317116 RepID=UPI000B5259FD|nr:TIGR02186 family protein [Oceanicola sp. 22II-s10i]OWU83300.1 membrane protein [Oceanicola sp. 22II-s10i]